MMTTQRPQFFLTAAALLVGFPAFGALFLTIISAFQLGPSVDLPPKTFSTIWLFEVVKDAQWRHSISDSLLIALVSTIIALPAGVAVAIGVRPLSQKYRTGIIGLLLLPSLVPPVLLAVGWYYPLHSLGLFDTHIGVAILHAILALPFVAIPTLVGFDRLGKAFWLAAPTLGITPIRTFVCLALPAIKPEIIVGTLLTIVFSLNEIAIALYTTALDVQPLVRGLWTGVRFEYHPIVFAVSLWLLFFEILLGVVLYVFVRKKIAPNTKIWHIDV